MGFTVRVFLFSVVLVALCAACAPRNYSLPANWPIPQLTVPKGAILICEPLEVSPAAQQPASQEWLAMFVYTGGSRQELIDHVESCLRPLGYNVMRIEEPVEDSTDLDPTYYSPDGLVEVSLLTFFADDKTGSTGMEEHEFSLMIKVSPIPHKVLEYVGRKTTEGTQVVLKPLEE